ncbi:MAG: hypothetical protein JXB85_08690 [Anaerolineales bacterium]|nr:hypothetical protein [Anaerolineales bacterium]
MPIYAILILVITVLMLISLGAAYIFSTTVLYARRQPIVKCPVDYGLAYEEVAFKSSDGLDLKGWYLPVPDANPDRGPERIVILTHPMLFNRHGFLSRHQGFPPLATTNVDLLTTAQALVEAGYPILMFDFRNHGQSESGLSGVGLLEYQDVLGALAYIRSRWASPPQVGFVSFCMGADATIVALSKGRGQVKDVRFLVAIQPVSAAVFIRAYLRAVYTPLSLYLAPLIDRITRWRGGFSLQEMSPRLFIKDVHVPTFYIQAKEDRWTELGEIQAFYAASPGPKELWLIEGIKKRFVAYNYVGEHPERILEFARRYFNE